MSLPRPMVRSNRRGMPRAGSDRPRTHAKSTHGRRGWRWRAATGEPHSAGVLARAALERSVLHEHLVEVLTLVRVLIAQARAEQTIGGLIAVQHMLERLRQDDTACRRSESLLEILVLTALTQSAMGCDDAALRVLRQALALGCAEGYARVFLDEGAPLRHLLYEWSARSSGQAADLVLEGYAARLQSAFASLSGVTYPPLPERSVVKSRERQVEPLSDRELEVLRLVASGASNHAIAAVMVISVGTVKSHVNHILGKLAARDRTEAVARARELMLLAD
jgi:LuxR family transcriptional regulator, maltose regulon positive regulatory protein